MTTRKKELRCILAFSTTTSAMAMQVACEETNLLGRTIPLPPQINAGCGLAWCCLPADQEKVLALARQKNIPLEDCRLIELIV